MDSHEVFCEELRHAVKGYTINELSEFIEKHLNNSWYLTYKTYQKVILSNRLNIKHTKKYLNCLGH